MLKNFVIGFPGIKKRADRQGIPGHSTPLSGNLRVSRGIIRRECPIRSIASHPDLAKPKTPSSLPQAECSD
jgi:hypothetical protein